MLARIGALASNTYREAVRARVLYGLLAAALAAAAYSVVVATLSLNEALRTIADVGTASISLFSVIVAIVLGATSLHRELELKTLFPILTRRLRRWEFVVGKFLGLWATLAVFVAIDGGAVLAMLAVQAKAALSVVGGALAAVALLFVGAMVRGRGQRVFWLMPWALVFFGTMAFVAAPAGAERQLVIASCLLTLGEVAIVGALALLFSAFSSPFLTAIFTLGMWMVGRSCETLANLPERYFGPELKAFGAALARVTPNLQLYVPPRLVLLGAVPDLAPWPFVARAEGLALAYATVILLVSIAIVRNRDFA
jgi:Cu-processing system permease protein